MSIFGFDFEASQRRNDEWRKSAREMFVPGIDPAELKPGMKITISPNLMIHDRSYTEAVHTVVSVNSCHVQTRGSGSYYKDRLIMLPVHEHHFYDASGFETGEENAA